MTREQFYKKLGQRVRAKRLELGLTQVDLGKRLKKLSSYICEIERGSRPVSAYLVHCLEKELGEL